MPMQETWVQYLGRVPLEKEMTEGNGNPLQYSCLGNPMDREAWQARVQGQQWPQDWKRSVFIPIQKESNAKECSNYCTTSLISHANKIMHKILQARLQQYMNQELSDVQTRLRKGRTRDQLANICWIMKKTMEFQKKIYFCFIDYAKAFV